MSTGELRSEPNSKVKISLHFYKDKVYSGDSSEITDLSPSANSAELGRVTVNTDDCEKIMTDKCKVRLGSGTKIDELQNPLKICIIFICIFFSTCGAEYFREKIEERWSNLRKESSTVKQSWLIPHPSRSAWSNSREFHKVSFVNNILGYKPRINTKDDAKCMDTYLKQVPESELVKSNLGPEKDYLPV